MVLDEKQNYFGNQFLVVLNSTYSSIERDEVTPPTTTHTWG